MSEFAESLVRQVEEHVKAIRSLSSTESDAKGDPITDDEPRLRVLCQLVERILRYGQKEKLSFWGDRKDYWNYMSDAAQGNRSLESLVKAVQSQSRLQTSQGRGRALIRKCLVEHSLAEMIQTCMTKDKQTTDWYRFDAILRVERLASLFVEALYNLNDVSFLLSDADQDLDNQWPSFSKKNFGASPPPASLSYSTYDVSHTTSLNPAVSVSESPIATPARPHLQAELRRKRSRNSDTSSLDGYVLILTNVLHSQNENEDENVVLPPSIARLKDDLTTWKNDNERRIETLENDVEHEKQEREADAADAERLQAALKTQLDEFRVAETRMRTRLDSTSKKVDDASTTNARLRDEIATLARRVREYEIDSLTWQTRVDEAKDECDDYRRRFDALDADHEFLCRANADLDRKYGALDDELARERRRNDDETALRAELESKLFEADLRLSQLLRDYESRQGDDEDMFERRERHVAELQELVTNQEKLVAAQEARVMGVKAEAKRKKIERDGLRVKVDVGRETMENLERVVESLKRDLSVAEERVRIRECEAREKDEVLMRVIGRRDDDDGGETSSLEVRLFDALRRESEAKERLVEAERGREEIVARLASVDATRERLEKRIGALERKGETYEGLWDAERKRKRDSEGAIKFSAKKLEAVDKKESMLVTQGSEDVFESDYVAALKETLERVKDELEEERKRRVVVEQEFSSLKFQISTESIQRKQQQEDVRFREKEREVLRKNFDEIEARVKTANEEKRAVEVEREEMRQKFENAMRKCELANAELSSLQEQLLQITVERDQRRRECLTLEDELKELKEKSGFADKTLNKQLEEIKAENSLIKDRLVKLTENKVEMWQAKEDLQEEVAARLSLTWLDESKVSKCQNCAAEFTMTIRKHHCRSCGRIFCASCSNYTLNLPSDSKPSRVCVICYDLIKEIKATGSIPFSRKEKRRSMTSLSGSGSTRLSTSGSTSVGERLRSRDMEESYAIIDEKDIRDAVPNYVSNEADLEEEEENQLDSDSTTIDFSLTGTRPDAPSATSQEDLDLLAGKKHKITVLAISENVRISWSFSLEGTSKDISFGVLYKSRGESRGDGDFLIPLKRFFAREGEPISGDITTQRRGIYTLLLDNTSSSVTHRKVSYKVKVTKPN